MFKLFLLKSTLFLYFAVIFIPALFLSSFLSSTVYASDVVINEFLVEPDSDQWVEIYNKGLETVNIEGWFIDDNGGSEKFIIPSGTIINPGEFKVFESGFFNLNRASSDAIKLLNGLSIEDSYSYKLGPGPNNSFGRSLDGEGDWVIFDNPTKGSTNNNSTPLPTATSTPSPTFTPTPTSKPTSTPKPTPTTKPTPTSKPTPTERASYSSTSTQATSVNLAKSSNPNVFVSAEDETVSIREDLSSDSAMPTSILGESTESGKTEISKKPQEKFLAESESNLPKIFIGFGIIFLGACGILGFRLLKKNQDEKF